MLAPNPIFISRGKKPQWHVKYQLACFLMQYGSHGSDVIGTAMKMSIGYSTVILYCHQVTCALQQLCAKYVEWPIAEWQEGIEERIEGQSGFPKCLGSGDGSLFHWEEWPAEDGEAFQNCKKFLGVHNSQIIIMDYIQHPTSCRLMCKPQLMTGYDLLLLRLDGQLLYWIPRSSSSHICGRTRISISQVVNIFSWTKVSSGLNSCALLPLS